MPTNPENAARIDALVAATQSLSDQVHELSEHLSISQDVANRAERQARRTRNLTKLMAAVVAISLMGVIATVIALGRVSDTVEQNKANQVINCQNANQSRAANLQLWLFVLDASAASNPNQTPQQKDLSMKFREWVQKLFAQRDCSDLTRKYEIPPPPTLGSSEPSS